MSFKEIQKEYLSQIPKFNTLPNFYTANELFELYRKETNFAEIEPINNIRFQRKFKEFVTNDEENRFLISKFREISALSQRLFDFNFPSS